MKLLSFLVAGLLSVANIVEGIHPPTASASLRGKDHANDGDWDGFGTSRRRLLPLSVLGLRHLYTGDSSNAHDSVGSAAGTLGVNTKFIAGRNGLGFEFDGTTNTMVTLPVDINSSVFPKLTMGFWVKLRTLDNNNNAWGLTNDDGHFDRAVILDDHRFNGVAGGIGWYEGAHQAYPSSLPRITVNEWHCVAVAYDDDADEATVYYDGQTETKTTDFPGPGLSYTGLGANPSFLTDDVDGIIDEVFMFDRYLTKSEIDTVCSELTNQPRGPIPEPCADIVCVNGQCVNGICECDQGWTGNQCDVEEDPCDGIDCVNGECIAGTCDCNEGYRGNECELKNCNWFEWLMQILMGWMGFNFCDL